MNSIKLTIELVPQTCWYSNVRSEVSKEDWEKIKKHFSVKAKYRCEICGGKGPKWPVECHEIWDYDDKNKIQKLVSMTSLCPSCHEVKHIGLASIKGRIEQATQHLACVNGWTEDTARNYVTAQFEIWKQRSLSNWTLDVSYIDSLVFLQRKKT